MADDSTCPPPLGLTTLQNGWYNALASALPAAPDSFQIALPQAPLAPTDLALWQAEGAIPPFSLTAPNLAAGPAFFTGYAAVAQALNFPESTFEADIGTANFIAWQSYLATITPPPTPDQLPQRFANWAIVHAPDVLSVGVADLTESALLFDSQQALAPYLGPGAKPADFAGGAAALAALLAVAPERTVAFDSATGDPDVSSTWTGGLDSGVGGLIAGSGPLSLPTLLFAASHVTVELTLDHLACWVATPGAWYDSGLLHLAFAAAGTPPWPACGPVSWNSAFGPGGTLPRFVASLFVADGVTATIRSDARYGLSARRTIAAGAAKGFWPLYAPNGGAVANVVSYDSTSALTITTTIAPGTPVVLGANVLSTARYLGLAAI